MKFKSKILIILVTAGILSCSACKKPEQYPLIPYIEYVGFSKIQNTTGIDQKGILTISFTDGDGDIGLAPGDTFAPFNPGSQYYYDMFVTYYERQHGQYVAVVLPLTNNLRIPIVTPTSGNKSIKGNIDVELFINNPVSTYDTIAYDVSIVDRALNMSNTIRTPDFIIKKN